MKSATTLVDATKKHGSFECIRDLIRIIISMIAELEKTCNVFLRCCIDTFTQAKDLNTSSTTVALNQPCENIQNPTN